MYSWLLVVLKLFLLIQPCFSSLNPSVLEQDIQGACKIVNNHYPFAISNLSAQNPRPGFEIQCNSGKPMVQLGNKSYNVTNITLDGQIRIFVPPFTSMCARVSTPAPITIPNLQGTPYTYNTTNKLTLIGCDARALIVYNEDMPPIGCASFCTQKDPFIENPSCTGVGCCQVPIPPGLKNFSLDFKSISEQACGTPQNKSQGVCNRVFILDPYKFNISSNELDSDGQPQEEVVLDWSIGNDTCDIAGLKDSFACVAENSSCSNSPDLFGYRCICSPGFGGNPYIEGGCTDIDECAEKNHDCVHKCENKIGGYECRCHFGTSGDGREGGNGCKRIAPLDIGLGTGLGFLLILFIVSSWSYWAFKKHKIRRLKHKYFLQNGGLLLQQHISSQVATARIFTTEELELATNGFHGSRVLGHGGYGTVYKGILPGNKPVAIKRSKLVDESQIEPFINEVVILSQVNHRNVVKLLGCCLETQVPLLVYEFISNGTLFQHLHAVKASAAASPLNWETRLRIAVETAAALAYLHGVASIPIIHRDVKSANILVDENYTAKVSDFGASRLVPHNRTHVTTVVQGTLGYLDPEYFHTSLLTDKSDVYSFGVVLAELLTRENPVSFGRSTDDGNLAFHFITLVKENRLIEALDKETIEEAGIKQLLAVAQLVKRCLNVKGEERPTMREVAIELEALRRLMSQHFVQEGKVYQTSTSASLMISDIVTQDSMKSMESHLLSESIISEPR